MSLGSSSVDVMNVRLGPVNVDVCSLSVNFDVVVLEAWGYIQEVGAKHICSFPINFERVAKSEACLNIHLSTGGGSGGAGGGGVGVG